MISEPERQPLTRAQLYDLVWSTPMSKLAKTFHCSDVWLARICEECDVPTPGRGYWAKKRAGKRANKRGLPKGADPHEIVLEFDPEPPTPAEQPPPPPPPLDADIAAMVEAFDKMGPLVVPEELSGPHPLVAEAKRALTNAIDTDRSRFGHLQPLWSKCDLSFNVGAESLDRALRLMDTLLRTFAKLKCPTTGPAEAYRRAPTEVLGEQFVFRLRERVRQRPFDPKKDKSTGPWDSPKIVCEPRGLFVLERCRVDGRTVERSWSDRAKAPLETSLARVVTDTLQEVQHLRWQRTAERQREIKRRKAEEIRRREQEARRIEKERVEALQKQVDRWDRASRIRQFLEACRASGNTQKRPVANT